MRVLVTWGSRHGGTEEIGRIIAEELRSRGFDVTADSADAVGEPSAFDAAIVGGALYLNRWPATVRRWVNRHAAELRQIPVWFFSSGPLDGSAAQAEIPPPDHVGVLSERVGAREHVTFGGRLEPDAEGFPASAMAGSRSGDWRDPRRVRAWAADVAGELPTARPGRAIDHPARSPVRLVLYGAVAWSVWAGSVGAVRLILDSWLATSLGVFLAALVFGAAAFLYFRAKGALEPLPTAIRWVGIAAVLHLIVMTAPAVGRGLADLASLARTWLPLAAIFLSTFGMGELVSILPRSEPARRKTGGS